MVPFLVNYALCWIAWFTMEKQKKFTWIAAILGCYPQLVAARIIHLFWTQPLKGMNEKKNLERNLMENEIFTEAVPSALIMTFLWLVSSGLPGSDLIIGEDLLDNVLFFVSFGTSFLSAGLGLAKCLKVLKRKKRIKRMMSIWGCPHIMSANFGGFQTPLPPRQQSSAIA